MQLFGFGASPKPRTPVSHCFPLNGNLSDASVDGVAGMNSQYLESVKAVDFSGPTNAAPCILKQVQDAKTRVLSVSGPLTYTVLLVLTDGDLDDMSATLEACAAASDMPMSIIFVGIGKCTFESMGPLRSGTPPGASRSCVSFIRMEDYGAGATARLRAKVLADLPGQVEQFFITKGIAAKR